MQFTEMFVTLNTNRRPVSAHEEQQMTAIVTDAVMRQMNSREGYLRVLTLKPGTQLVNVTILSFSVEVGSKLHRLHCHFNLSITHQNGGIIYRRTPNFDPNRRKLRDFFNRIFLQHWTQKCYVDVQLMDTRAKNYNTKQARRRHTAARSIGPVLATRDASGGEDRHAARDDTASTRLPPAGVGAPRPQVMAQGVNAVRSGVGPQNGT